MALQLTDALADGIGRTITRTGGIIFAVLLTTQLLLLASINTAVTSQFPGEMGDVIGLTLPVSGSVAVGLLVGTFVFNAVFFVVVARAFVRPRAELSSFPSALYTRRMVRATLSMIIGGVVVFVLVMIGFVFLILPGLFLSACFLFFIFAIGVEDRGVIGAMRRSWGLARGNRLRLVVFVVVVGVLGGIVGIPSAIFQAVGVPVVGDLVTSFVNSVMFVFVYGIMASMYVQLEDDGEEPSGSAEPTPGTQPAD